MPGIRLLTAKVINPIEKRVTRTSRRVLKLIGRDDYFVNFQKQDKKAESGFFEFSFGKYSYTIIKRMADKYKWIEDLHIKKFINKKINDDGILSPYQQHHNEDLMDAYNVLQGHYSILGNVDRYYKQYKATFDEKCTGYMAKLSMLDKKTLNDCIEYYKQDKPSLVKGYKTDINFIDDQQTEALKKYVAMYYEEEPEITNYMYTKYYLPRLSKNVRENCEKISKEFGTKVFVYDEKEQQNLDFIYDELMDWKQASKGKSKFPSIIDLSKIKEDYISKIEEGYIKTTKAFILNADKSMHLDCLSSIRHEMIHLNQEKVTRTDLLIRHIYVDDILSERPYQEELIKAGVDPDTAYKNIYELQAHSGSKDCTKYSREFKSLLIDLGLPEWVFDLKPLRQIVEE